MCGFYTLEQLHHSAQIRDGNTIPSGTNDPSRKFFTVIDALKGYHQVPLDDESAEMTTFSTPLGRYMYRRLPFGICHAGDDYSRRVSAVFDDLPNCRRIIEDIEDEDSDILRDVRRTRCPGTTSFSTGS